MTLDKYAEDKILQAQIDEAKDAFMPMAIEGARDGMNMDIFIATFKGNMREHGCPDALIFLYESWIREAYEKVGKE